MTVLPRLIFPWALVLLVLVPWCFYAGAQMRSLGAARKWLAVGLRCIILVLLILALAGAELVRHSDKLAVFFLLDQSNSIPEDVRLASVEAVQQIMDLYMTDRDEAGIIAFGERASIELSVSPRPELGRILSYVGGEQSDLAAAVRLATAAFPQGAMRRIVVLSDGNETVGSALEEVRIAWASGVGVDVVPLDTGGGAEVRIRNVDLPNRVNAGEPFQMRVVVEADQASDATLRVFQKTLEGKHLLQSAPVRLQPGDNAFVLPQELNRSGFYEYEATIESGADTIMANNEGRAFTVIYGEPTVLYVEGKPSDSLRLGPALREQGVQTVQTDPGGLPASLTELQNYDAVVLSNVSSTDISSTQLAALGAMVRDLGIGLVMVGGPDTYGAGGYLDTPVEDALPVDMDIKQRKVLPRGALALILHTCEIPEGNMWSREIGLAALNVLSAQDLMGALAYTFNGDEWLFHLQPVGNKALMRQILNSAVPGDMPATDPTLRMAYEALSPAQAAVKRIVLISDGDPAAPSAFLLDQMQAEGISVSTVCIAPHTPSDQDMLKWVADRTGGNFYFVTNPNNLPQIFTKEAAIVKRGLLIEEPFVPKRQHESELMAGLGGGFPELDGYVVTTPKANATVPLVSHEGDPVLAHWRYGLGKAVAYTSDVTTLWGRQFIDWQHFSQFWAQAVRWAMREVDKTNFRVDTRVEGGMGHVRIDAVDEAGQFVNFLRPEGVVTGPGPEFGQTPITLMQTGPGIYEGRFPVPDKGVYMLNITYARPDGSRGMLPAGLALNYSREYEYNAPNRALLENLAAAGGGELLGAAGNPFRHDLSASPSVTPIWPQLAMLALCLFPIEIFIRRVTIDYGALLLWLLRPVRAVPGLRRWVPRPRLRPAPVTGMYYAGPAEQRDYTSAATGTFGQVVRAEPETTAPDAMDPAAPARAQAAKSDYTQQLLAAKERAMAKAKRRSGGGPKE